MKNPINTKKVMLGLMTLCLSGAALAQIPVTPPGGGGGAPSGGAGGDLGGTYPNPTVVASHIASGGAAFTDKVGVSSPTVTSTTPTFSVTDSEPAATVMIGASILAPNIATNNDLYFLFGQTNTTNNGYYMRYSKRAPSNFLAFQAVGQPPQFSLFPSGDSAFGNVSSDSGFKLDVVGTFRAQTSVTSPTYLTPNSFVGRSQTGALNQTVVASASTAMYQIALASNCKTAVTSAAYTATVTYTDTSNTTQTIGSGSIPCDTLGAASRFNSVSVANVLTGTAISLATTTTGSVSYDVAVTATQATSN